MEAKINYFSNSQFSWELLEQNIGQNATNLLKDQQKRIVLIDAQDDCVNIYQNETIKYDIKFEFCQNVKNLTNATSEHDSLPSPLSFYYHNQNELECPLVVFLAQGLRSFDFVILQNSHVDFVLIEGMNVLVESHHIVLKSNSTLNYARFFAQKNISQEPKTSQRLIEIHENAILHDNQIFLPNGEVHVLSKIKLLGKGAHAYSAGCLIAEKGNCTYEPIQEHFETYTKSFLDFKVVLTKRAKNFFRGLVVMHKNAQKSEAYQENKNLLLSRYARADSEPRLEIIPNDVICKHGSATAEIDFKQLYYLMTRGFNQFEGKEMIVKSFCHSAFQKNDNRSKEHATQTLVDMLIKHIFENNADICHP